MLHGTAEIDEAFIGRVYRTSVWVWLSATLVLLGFRSLGGVAGWTLGCAVSMWTLWSLEWIVRRAFVPGNLNAGSSLGKFSVLKIAVILPILGLAAWASSRSIPFLFAFCAGVLLTQAVIFFTVVVVLISRRSND